LRTPHEAAGTPEVKPATAKSFHLEELVIVHGPRGDESVVKLSDQASPGRIAGRAAASGVRYPAGEWRS